MGDVEQPPHLGNQGLSSEAEMYNAVSRLSAVGRENLANTSARSGSLTTAGLDAKELSVRG